jgi:hypothetical protein
MALFLVISDQKNYEDFRFLDNPKMGRDLISAPSAGEVVVVNRNPYPKLKSKGQGTTTPRGGRPLSDRVNIILILGQPSPATHTRSNGVGGSSESEISKSQGVGHI